MSDFQHISVADTAKLLADNKVVVADIRDEGSFAAGHIDGAYHLTNGSLNSFMQQFEFDQPVVVVCYHGNSSQGAAQYLVQQGFDIALALGQTMIADEAEAKRQHLHAK